MVTSVMRNLVLSLQIQKVLCYCFGGQLLLRSSVCENFIQSIDEKVESADDARASCSQSEKNSIIYSKLSRCDYYGASHADCAKYINEELTRTCGGSHNCIATENYDYAGVSTYYNNTDK